jgi:hypothetical protein
VNGYTIFCVFTHLLATSRARLLLTSREELPLPGATQIRLIGMADAEASQLLSELKAGLREESVHAPEVP